jgi:two-component system NtrC family sensor kinase
MPSLYVIQGRDQGTRHELTPLVPTLTIGRDHGNSIQIHDTEVSRRHAEILLSGEIVTVTDLGSANGTWVNSERVERRELKTGDQVQLGRTVLLFTRGSDAVTRDADERVSIVNTDKFADQSRILSSVAQTEGSQLLSLDYDPTQSNWLAQARGNLQLMYRTALTISHTLDIDQLLDRLLQMIFDWVEADRGCVMLLDQETGLPQPRVRRDRKVPAKGKEAEEDTLHISQTILDYVLAKKEGVLTSNARDDQRFDAAASIVRQGVREAICVPMQGRYGMVGVIYIDTLIPAAQTLSKGNRKFNKDHLKLMVAIGHQAALAVEDTNYYSAMLRSERLAAMGTTIATLSHHIKNILQGIRGGSYLIDMGLSEHDEPLIRKGWDIVERNQKRISNMVLDMLTFSKEREPERAAGDLNRTIHEVVEIVQSRANDKGIELVWQSELRLPRLIYDDEGLHRAILNVLSNAVDAVEERVLQDQEAATEGTPRPNPLPPRVTISVGLSHDAKFAEIVIEDTGAGIEPERISDIFNLFVSSKGSRGTGLGLPVSQKILREHGGQIVVTSEPGQGSRFLLEFPAQREEQHQTRSVPIVPSDVSQPSESPQPHQAP